MIIKIKIAVARTKGLLIAIMFGLLLILFRSLSKRFFIKSNEQKHGYYMEKDGNGDVTMFGRYHHGVKTGYHWRMCPGGGYLVAEVDSLDNAHGDDVVYIYPDLRTCIIGKFSSGCMKQGAYGYLSGLSIFQFQLQNSLILAQFKKKFFQECIENLES